MKDERNAGREVIKEGRKEEGKGGREGRKIYLMGEGMVDASYTQ